ELAPNVGFIRNTLGVVHYRVGDWKSAVAELAKSMEFRQGGDSFDWFFLAMSCWQLGQKEQAGKWLAAATTWMEKHPKDPELTRFRAAAAALLATAPKPSGPSPANVDPISIYSLLLETDPTAVWAYSKRGHAHADARQWDKAQADFEKAIERGSDDVRGVWY